MLMIQMSIRVRIMIDDDIDKKIKRIQTKMIKKSSESVSFSRVISEELRKALK